ncbi:hypothetical protein FPV67DRAFT_1673321 [Lyophyllum atratum]|nr:hypothetical protein FPV67DRAFT_1673321 [Lyophyllum atratum]
MQFRATFAQIAALILLPAALAAPSTASTQLSCQVGGIWGASDALCSASCIAQGQGYHGGYCNAQQVCVCNYGGTSAGTTSSRATSTALTTSPTATNSN